MKKPFLSVIIPAYNEEGLLPKALASLKKQTLDQSLSEVVVVDNNSTDKTSEVAKKFKVKVISETKQGILFARDKGLRSTQGEIIASTDADTILPPFWLKKIYDHFQAEPNLVGVFGPVRLRKKGGQIYLPPIIYSFLNLIFFLNLRLGKPLFIGSNYALKRKPFLKAGGYRVIKGEIDDVPTGLLAGSLGKVIFDHSLIVYPSARRFEEEGLIKNVVFAFIDYLQMVWLKKPVGRKGALSTKKGKN
jgi:glycosyltransferase involved in cell wall biosynthesis